MNRRDVLGALALWGGGGFGAWAWDELGDPVGRMVSHSGMVRVVRAGKSVKIAPQLRMRVGDRLEVGASARAEVIHTLAGTRYRLEGPVTVRVREDLLVEVVPGKTPAQKPTEKEARGAVRLADPRIVTLSRTITGYRAKGMGGAFAAASPQGALRPGTPVVLSWANRLTPEQRAAAKIVVTLTRDGEREPVLTRELPGDSDAFPLPDGLLRGDVLLHWEARAFAPRTPPTFADGKIFLLASAEAVAVGKALKERERRSVRLDAVLEQARAHAADTSLPSSSLAARKKALAAAEEAAALPWRERAEILVAAGLFAEAWDAYVEAWRRMPADTEIPEEMRSLALLLGRRVPEAPPGKE